MTGYLEDFLDNYIEHILDYDTLIFILSLLPSNYQYQFAINLNQYKDKLSSGDLYEGIVPNGRIIVDDYEIILKYGLDDEKTVVLLSLPPSWEV